MVERLCVIATDRIAYLLRQEIANLDEAYDQLRPDHVKEYNAALSSIVPQLEQTSAAETRFDLAEANVSLDLPKMKLPLVGFHRIGEPNETAKVGVPMVIEYDTTQRPLYPPEGMLMPARAIYLREAGRARLRLTSGEDEVSLKGMRVPLATDYKTPGLMLAHRARPLARTGFISMIRPARMKRKPHIYLLDPYDPNKIPVLMVHGLQSTPVAFVDLVNALHSDPEIREHFQIWHFHYATGTPVLVNAQTLREELAKTIREVDPNDQHRATQRIVVLGHSMGGVIAHTLVSSSGDRLWGSLFTAPPHALKGDPEHIHELARVMHFRRNPRIARVIFLATPHRGSSLADNWIGAIAKFLTRLPPILQTGLTDIGRTNADAMTPQGAAFYKRQSFSAIRTLSSRSPSLLALSRLPIAVPFHSIMGQKHAGAREARDRWRRFLSQRASRWRQLGPGSPKRTQYLQRT